VGAVAAPTHSIFWKMLREPLAHRSKDRSGERFDECYDEEVNVLAQEREDLIENRPCLFIRFDGIGTFGKLNMLVLINDVKDGFSLCALACVIVCD
jgi:hypothetical protein